MFAGDVHLSCQFQLLGELEQDGEVDGVVGGVILLVVVVILDVLNPTLKFNLIFLLINFFNVDFNGMSPKFMNEIRRNKLNLNLNNQPYDKEISPTLSLI